SSRRRHTRFDCDWSSDVCSSDLQHGESGLPISSLFPHTARYADDLCVIRSMHADTAAHASGCLQMNSGSIFIGKPSLGAWLNYRSEERRVGKEVRSRLLP